jgi:hypothetical protein
MFKTTYREEPRRRNPRRVERALRQQDNYTRIDIANHYPPEPAGPASWRAGWKPRSWHPAQQHLNRERRDPRNRAPRIVSHPLLRFVGHPGRCALRRLDARCYGHRVFSSSVERRPGITRTSLQETLNGEVFFACR